MVLILLQIEKRLKPWNVTELCRIDGSLDFVCISKLIYLVSSTEFILDNL